MATPPNTGKQSLRDRWEAMPAKTRKSLTVVGALGAVLLLSSLVIFSDTGGGNRKTNNRIDNALLLNDGSKDLGSAAIANEVGDLGRRMREMEGENARLKSRLERQNTDAGVASPDARFQSELTELRRQIADMQKNGVGGPQRPGQTPAAPSTPNQPNRPVRPGVSPSSTRPAGLENNGAGEGAPAPMAAYGGIRTIMAEEPAKPAEVADAKRPQTPSMYLPTGAMMTGVLLSGVDAPTGKSAIKDPIPVLARVKHDAILPNRYKADVKECFALLEARGDLASERAMMRLSNLSCVRRDRSVIDIPMSGYAIGEDGRAGMRGRLVSKQGQVLAKAMMAGFAEGISRAFGGQNQGLNGLTGGQVDYGQVPEQGLVGGASSALDRVAAYYLSLADQLHPTVEIDAGRRVTVVLLKGREMQSLAVAGNRNTNSR